MLAHITTKVTMDPDELLEQIMSEENCVQPVYDSSNAIITQPEQTQIEEYRSRLSALVAGGTAKQYLGKNVSLTDIDDMPQEEVIKLYARYEARLGAMMTKTLGSSALRLYSMAASAFLPISLEQQPHLVADLEGDPFVGHAVTTACCELYHRYGMYLAPLTAAITTVKHCQFGEKVEQYNRTTHGGESHGYWTNSSPRGESSPTESEQSD